MRVLASRACLLAQSLEFVYCTVNQKIFISSPMWIQERRWIKSVCHVVNTEITCDNRRRKGVNVPPLKRGQECCRSSLPDVFCLFISNHTSPHQNCLAPRSKQFAIELSEQKAQDYRDYFTI